MSLIREADLNMWESAANLADTCGMLDLADQVEVVRDTDPERAEQISALLGGIITQRLADQSLPSSGAELFQVIIDNQTDSQQ